MDIFQQIYIFLASMTGEFFGSMFGGGSFFIQPALIAAGITANTAVANDITAAVFSNFAFLWFYRKQKRSIGFSDYRSIVLWMAPSLIIGAMIGGYVLSTLPPSFIKGFIVLICCAGLVHGIYNIYQPTDDLEDKKTKFIPHWKLFIFMGALGLGFYDGFSGAGSGVLIIMLLTTVLGLDMKTIFSLANVVSSISLGTAAITFLFLGLLSPQLLMIMIPACIVGGALGAKAAIFMPEKGLRIIYACLIFAVISYLLVDIFSAT
jgi:uncharacterized membrane protein YfcA